MQRYPLTHPVLWRRLSSSPKSGGRLVVRKRRDSSRGRLRPAPPRHRSSALRHRPLLHRHSTIGPARPPPAAAHYHHHNSNAGTHHADAPRRGSGRHSLGFFPRNTRRTRPRRRRPSATPSRHHRSSASRRSAGVVDPPPCTGAAVDPPPSPGVVVPLPGRLQRRRVNSPRRSTPWRSRPPLQLKIPQLHLILSHRTLPQS
ncbi:unnamed protein product [Urochloa humidicola]